MEINLLILGCLFILILFTVGESITKHFHINKWVALVIIGLLIVSMFIQPLSVWGYELYFDRLILPTIISFGLLFAIKKPSRFILAFLVCTLAAIIYLISGVENNYYVIFQPLYILSGFLGILVAIVASNLPESICALFFGLHAGSLMFNLTKYESLENMFLSTSLFIAVLIGFIVATLIVFIKQKMLIYNQNQEIEKLL